MSKRLEHRTERILKLLLQRGSVSVEELITSLSASAPSIRRDLARLESKGLVKRTHGGATLVQELLYEPFRYDTAFQTREQQFVREKRHIGAAAAELIQKNETIGFTAGTTTTWVARNLRHRTNLSVITNAVNMAMVLFAGWPRRDYKSERHVYGQALCQCLGNRRKPWRDNERVRRSPHLSSDGETGQASDRGGGFQQN